MEKDFKYNIKDTVDSDEIDNYITDSILNTISENIDSLVDIAYEPSDPSVGIMNDGVFLDNAQVSPFYFELDILEIFEKVLNSLDFIKHNPIVIFSELDSFFVCNYNYIFSGVFNKGLVEIEDEDINIDFHFEITNKEYNFKTKKYKIDIEFVKAI